MQPTWWWVLSSLEPYRWSDVGPFDSRTNVTFHLVIASLAENKQLLSPAMRNTYVAQNANALRNCVIVCWLTFIFIFIDIILLILLKRE